MNVILCRHSTVNILLPELFLSVNQLNRKVDFFQYVFTKLRILVFSSSKSNIFAPTSYIFTSNLVVVQINFVSVCVKQFYYYFTDFRNNAFVTKSLKNSTLLIKLNILSYLMFKNIPNVRWQLRQRIIGLHKKSVSSVSRYIILPLYRVLVRLQFLSPFLNKNFDLMGENSAQGN